MNIQVEGLDGKLCDINIDKRRLLYIHNYHLNSINGNELPFSQ